MLNYQKGTMRKASTRIAIRIIIGFQTDAPGFRFFALKKGKEYGIKGVIPGIRNNILIIQAESNPRILRNYYRLLKAGTPFSKINTFSTQEIQLLNYTSHDTTHNPDAKELPKQRLNVWLVFSGLKNTSPALSHRYNP